MLTENGFEDSAAHTVAWATLGTPAFAGICSARAAFDTLSAIVVSYNFRSLVLRLACARIPEKKALAPTMVERIGDATVAHAVEPSPEHPRRESSVSTTFPTLAAEIFGRLGE